MLVASKNDICRVCGSHQLNLSRSELLETVAGASIKGNLNCEDTRWELSPARLNSFREYPA
jgi:hypothetical protein